MRSVDTRLPLDRPNLTRFFSSRLLQGDRSAPDSEAVHRDVESRRNRFVPPSARHNAAASRDGPTRSPTWNSPALRAARKPRARMVPNHRTHDMSKATADCNSAARPQGVARHGSPVRCTRSPRANESSDPCGPWLAGMLSTAAGFGPGPCPMPFEPSQAHQAQTQSPSLPVRCVVWRSAR